MLDHETSLQGVGWDNNLTTSPRGSGQSGPERSAAAAAADARRIDLQEPSCLVGVRGSDIQSEWPP
jgi:hypothetical protein